MRKISILLVDDHTVVRQALRALLAVEDDMEIVGEAENGWQAIKLVRELRPEIVIMDLAMPSLNGLEATRQILKEFPSTRVIVLSSYSDDEYVKEMTEAGVAGYLIKQTAAQDLLKAIREVHLGNAFFSPSIARRLRDSSREAFRQGSAAPVNLTDREMQVLELIARSYSNKDVSVALGISVKTVEKHRQQVMNKLRIHDVAGLTLYAANRGLLANPKVTVPLGISPAPENTGTDT